MSDVFRRITLVLIDAKPRTSIDRAVRIMTHEEFATKRPHLPSPVYVNNDRHSDPTIARHQETIIDQQPPEPID
ncbi:hypothetical protein F2Q69_00012991 [Brassica cretica]|uniref:Uncharacterized protein n=1 Tax=Brassica cretica TaxID=69181 RepID=A0A8S9R396_BRACR|nr:hypothetical protein F2Q69_00012991 [Brassica cretica]